jgi:hypothetical protein
MLWDGQSGAGWRSAKGGTFPTQGWRTKNGELVVTGGGGGDIVTDTAFDAFELQLEFQLTPGANSGIKYFVGDGPDEVGLEYQLLDDERHPDAKQGIEGNRTLASLYDIQPRSALMGNLGIAPKIGKWQHARIIARRDGTVEHWQVQGSAQVRRAGTWPYSIAGSRRRSSFSQREDQTALRFET